MPNLQVIQPPPVVFFNDGGNQRRFEVTLLLTGAETPRTQLAVTLLYEGGNHVEDQSILKDVASNRKYLSSGEPCVLAYSISQVSSKHFGRKFKLQFACGTAYAETSTIEVRAKPPRRRQGKQRGNTCKRKKLLNCSSSPLAKGSPQEFSDSLRDVLQKIECNQMHILNAVVAFEQLSHRILRPTPTSHSCAAAAAAVVAAPTDPARYTATPTYEVVPSFALSSHKIADEGEQASKEDIGTGQWDWKSALAWEF